MRLFRAGSYCRGWTLVEMICVIAIITILAALLLPGLAKARDRARQTRCAGQLKQIGLVFHSFAHDHNNLLPMQVPIVAGGSMEYTRAGSFSNSFAFRHFQALGADLGSPKVLVCPSDDRLPAAGFTALNNGNVSYFVALNSDYQKPASLLAGDRNLTNDWAAPSPVQRLGPNYLLRWSHELHRFRGNLLFADAHVEQLGGAGLRTATGGNGGNTYVLNLPADPPPSVGARTTGSTPGFGVAPYSSTAGTDVQQPNTPVREPAAYGPEPAKSAQSVPQAPSRASPLKATTAVAADHATRPALSTSVGMSSAGAQKNSAGNDDRQTNTASVSAGPVNVGTSPASTPEHQPGFAAEILDISMKFLWIYYLGLVLVALLALLLRKYFLPTKDESPQRTQGPLK